MSIVYFTVLFNFIIHVVFIGYKESRQYQESELLYMQLLMFECGTVLVLSIAYLGGVISGWM